MSPNDDTACNYQSHSRHRGRSKRLVPVKKADGQRQRCDGRRVSGRKGCERVIRLKEREAVQPLIEHLRSEPPENEFKKVYRDSRKSDGRKHEKETPSPNFVLFEKPEGKKAEKRRHEVTCRDAKARDELERIKDVGVHSSHRTRQGNIPINVGETAEEHDDHKRAHQEKKALMGRRRTRHSDIPG